YRGSMPYTQHQAADDHLLTLQLTGAIDADTLHAINMAIADALTRAAPAVLDVLIDAQALTHYPTNLKQLRAILTFFETPNLGVVLVWGGSTDRSGGQFHCVYGTAAQLARATLRGFSTLSDALRALRHYRANREIDTHQAS
ncbi:MAG: hypothetical protein ACOCXZ_04245, partial [Chloroflexota bacterium]